MYEKLNEANEFNGLSERGQSEYLDKFQDNLENNDDEEKTDNPVSFLGNVDVDEKKEKEIKEAEKKLNEEVKQLNVNLDRVARGENSQTAVRNRSYSVAAAARELEKAKSGK